MTIALSVFVMLSGRRTNEISIGSTVLVLSLLTVTSDAQDLPVADVAAGYSMIHVVRGFSLTANGSNGSAALNVSRWFGIAGDLGLYRTTGGAGVSAVAYTAGPRFSYRHRNRLTPFGQVLLDGSHTFMAQKSLADPPTRSRSLGGGADFAFGSGRFGLRPQVEYFGYGTPSEFGFGSATGTVRVSVDIGYRIPHKYGAN
jgi:hypothetical protein